MAGVAMTGTSFDLSGRSEGGWRQNGARGMTGTRGKSAKKCLLFGGGSYCCHYLMIQATLQSSSLVVSIIQSLACQVITASAAERQTVRTKYPSVSATKPNISTPTCNDITPICHEIDLNTFSKACFTIDHVVLLVFGGVCSPEIPWAFKDHGKWMVFFIRSLSMELGPLCVAS